ncbi:MAG: hypothetical protein M3220_13095 [Chloroflexota bacterium]|nr:hypothetical protein [Chloroflexota bacterium]
MAKEKREQNSDVTTEYGRSDDLRDSEMMTHLLDALEEGTDIGHYGRLVFVMVARFFMEEEEMAELLADQPDFDEEEARALILQVKAKGYNPPKREKILAWQAQQEFPICPTPNDPDTCDVYSDLRFPEDIYEHIEDYWEEKVEAQS